MLLGYNQSVSESMIRNLEKRIPLFTWSGIPFSAHWTVFLCALLWVLRDNSPGAFKLNLGILVVLVVSILCHEIGHALAARSVGGRAKEIVLWPLGGYAVTTNPGGFREAIWITLAGPLTHIPLSILFALAAVAVGLPASWEIFNPLSYPQGAETYWTYLFAESAKLQLWLILLNLFVPAYPLDCGRIVANVLLWRGKSPRLVSTVLLFMTVAAAVAVLVFLRSFFFAAFLLYTAWPLYQARRDGQLARHPLFQDLERLKARSGSRVRRSSHLRLVKKSGTKSCPKCQRSLPETARMCGFCEIEV